MEQTKDAELKKNWVKEKPEVNSPQSLYVDIFDSVGESNGPNETVGKDGVVGSIRWG